jgi:hypothetical protein
VLGRVEPFLLLLTVDIDGHPRHCALSRTELAVVGSFLDAALYARRTGENLLRDGTATLVAVDDDEIVSFRLATNRTLRVDGLLTVRFDVLGMNIDSLGVELRSPTFVPTAELARSERWDATRRALDTLRESDG